MEKQRKFISCRICLRYDLTTTDKCFSLFEKYNNYNTNISEKIKYVTNLEITQDDGLPDKICPDCTVQLETAIVFKQKCESSDKILKNVMLMRSKMCKVTFMPLLQVTKELEIVADEVPINTYNKPDENFLPINSYNETDEDILPIHTYNKPDDNFLPINTYNETDEDILPIHTYNEPDEKKIPINTYNESEDMLPIHTYNESDVDIPTYSDNEENKPELFEPDDKINSLVKKSKEKDLICDDCGGSFKSKCKIAVHWKKVHLPSKLICPTCKRVFKSFKAFNVHVKNKSRSCLICSEIHVEGQGKQRVFHCLTCTYYTKNIRSMDAHLTVHTGERCLQCKDCNKRFTQHDSLQAHKESCHKGIQVENVMQMTSDMCKVTLTPLLPVKKEAEVVVEKSLDTYEHTAIHLETEENKPDLSESHDKIKPVLKKSKAIDLKLICDDCGASFKSKCKMAVHWKKTHLPSKLICPICKRIFKSFKAFNLHAKEKKRSCLICSEIRVEGQGKQRVFHCLTCTYYSKDVRFIDSHLTVHTGERRYECKECNKRFTQRSSLLAHQECFHEDFRVERSCPDCGKIIIGRDRFYKHQLTHQNKGVQCKVCKKILKSQTILRKHMKRHSGVKNCVCEFCSDTFYTIGELCTHRNKVHLKKNIFKCDLCKHCMTTKEALKRHRAKHTATNVVCLVCGVFAEDAKKLALHQKRHIEKNFSCVHCDGVFYRENPYAGT